MIVVDYVPVASDDASSGNMTNMNVTVSVVTNDVDGNIVDPTTVSLAGTCDVGFTDGNGDCLQITVPGEGVWS